MVNDKDRGRWSAVFDCVKELIRLSTGHFRSTETYVVFCVIAAIVVFASPQAESQGTIETAGIDGYVRDSAGKPVANVTVSLKLESAEAAVAKETRFAHTDAEGHYRFEGLRSGTYTVRGELPGYIGAFIAGTNIAPNQKIKIDLVLKPTGNAETLGASAAASASKSDLSRPEFFDEPQFTVAGVTQASSAGGHGSDTVLRSTEALAKATVSLSKESSATEKSTTVSERSLLDSVASHPNDPEAHHRLADSEEKLKHPLEALREYERAAQLDPSERNIFDWGTELLAHSALEPAGEVFTQGTRRYPKSVRMLIALGVSWYGRGSYDQATDCLVRASDLAPDDATPYLFLGKMQAVADPSEKALERLARFARLQPDNALANYYYAVGLAKQFSRVAAEQDQQSLEQSGRLEALLQKAVRLDPKLGAAYLQLGIIYSQRADFSSAISAYRKSIEVFGQSSENFYGNNSSENNFDNETMAGEAHYRLAQAYSRIGEKARAQEELQIHSQIIKKTKEDEQRKLRETEEFVFSIREKRSGSKSPNEQQVPPIPLF